VPLGLFRSVAFALFVRLAPLLDLFMPSRILRALYCLRACSFYDETVAVKNIGASTR